MSHWCFVIIETKDFRLLIVISPNDPQPPIKTLKSWAWWLNIHVHGSISLDSIPSCEIDSMAPFLYAFCLEFKSAHIRGHLKLLVLVNASAVLVWRLVEKWHWLVTRILWVIFRLVPPYLWHDSHPKTNPCCNFSCYYYISKVN